MNILFLFRYSFKNLWRNPIRTLILLFGLSISTAFIIWTFNMNHSATDEVINELTKQFVGKEQIAHPLYFSSDNTNFNQYKQISQELIDSIFINQSKLTPRITSQVFISGEQKSVGSLFIGISPEKERRLTFLAKNISKGSFLTSNQPNPILLGRKLAHKLDVKLGEEIVIMGQAVDGSIANDLFTVTGIINFGGGDLEEKIVLTNLKSARQFLAMQENRFHLFVSFANEPLANKNEKIAIKTWSELLPDIGLSTRFVETFVWIISFIIILVVSLGITNTIMVSFLERQKEMETLTIIGAKSYWVTTSLGLEIIFLTTLSLFVGNTIGFFATMFFQYHPINLELFTGGEPILMGGVIIHPTIRLSSHLVYYIQTNLMVIAFIILAMIYPIHKTIKRSRRAF